MKPGEVGAAAALIAAAFTGEAAGLGLAEVCERSERFSSGRPTFFFSFLRHPTHFFPHLTQHQWAALLTAELQAMHPGLIAVAVRGDDLVGVVVLRMAGGEGGGACHQHGWWAPYRAAASVGGLPAAARLALRDAVLPEAVAPHELLIEYMCVAPAARRQGVAGALLAAAADRVAAQAGAGKRTLCLWVAAPNAAAVALYARDGFAVTQATAGSSWLTRAACSLFLGGAAWLRMEKAVVVVAGTKAPAALLPPTASPPASPRLASYRPGRGVAVTAAM